MAEDGNSLLAIEHTHTNRINEISSKVRDTFGVFGVALEIVEVKVFPDGICVLLRPVEHVRMQVIRSFEDDLRFALGRSHVEVVAPIPDEQLIGVTIFMNVRREIYGVEHDDGVISPWTTDMQEEVLYEQAKEIVLEMGNASISLLARRFNIGYAHAVVLMDLLEERGIVGPDDGSGKRQVYRNR